MRIPGSTGVDVVGLARGVAGDDECIAETAFCAAVDHVATVGRRRGIGVPEERVVAGIAVEDVRTRTAGAVQATGDRVIAGAAVDRVVARQGIDRVVAGRAVQRVVACRGPRRAARWWSPA